VREREIGQLRASETRRVEGDDERKEGKANSRRWCLIDNEEVEKEEKKFVLVSSPNTLNLLVPTSQRKTAKKPKYSQPTHPLSIPFPFLPLNSSNLAKSVNPTLPKNLLLLPFFSPSSRCPSL